MKLRSCVVACMCSTTKNRKCYGVTVLWRYSVVVARKSIMKYVYIEILPKLRSNEGLRKLGVSSKESGSFP